MNRINAWLIFAVGLLLPGVTCAGEHLSDHQEYCRQSPQTPCLTLLEQALAQTPLHSMQWFKLQSYRLDFLYDQVRYNEIYDESNRLLKISDAPQAFRTQLYFFQVKTLLARGATAEAAHYAELASRNLDAIYQAFSDPMRLLELANLQVVSGHYQQAWEILLHAQHRFYKSRNPLFLFELNSNKAAVRHAQQALDDAAYYRKQALDAVLPSGRYHDIIVAFGNLARTYQLSGKLGLAVDYYEQSLIYMRAGTDDLQHAVHRLRLAELYFDLQRPAKAAAYLQQVNTEILGDGHKVLYQTLSKALK